MRKALVGVPIAVLVVIGGMVLMRGPMRAAEKPVTEADLIMLARQGTPVVSAIYAYKQENGLWPRRIEDMVPRFATQAQLQGWSYTWHYWGRWSLEKWGQFNVVRVKYEDEEPSPGWFADYGEGEEPLKVDQPLPTTHPADGAELAKRIEVELARRTVAEPQEADYWRCLISFYIRQARFHDARQTYDRLAATLTTPPEWGQALLAYLDFKEGHGEAGERRLRALTAATPSFANHVYLYSYLQWTGQRDKAIAEVDAIASLNTFGDVNNSIPDGILYDAGRLAYRAGQYSLVLKVADAYQRMEKVKGYSEGSYHAMRACALLALGEFDEALPSCDAAIQRNSQQRTWCGDLKELREAIVRKDSKYAYQGWDDYPPPLQLLVDYQ